MKIISTGSYLPNERVTNESISKDVKWIESKLGIKERRRAANTSADLGFYAGMKALQNAFLAPRFVDMIIVATSTPAKMHPSTAAIIQYHLGCFNAVAYDINAVCSGFVYAMAIAEAFKEKYHNILIIGTDTFSKVTDYTHRNCVFFGDGAGAIMVRSSPNPLHYKLGTNGTGKDSFKTEWSGTFEMNGKEVFDAGMKYLPKTIKEALRKAKIEKEEIDYVVPHQASLHMLKALAKETGIPFEKFKTNMDRYGNTAAASIPILLDENKFEQGDKLLLVAIGSGWTYGAIVIEW